MTAAEYYPSLRVRHRVYGDGVITNATTASPPNGQRVLIHFDSGRTIEYLTAFADVEVDGVKNLEPLP